MDSKHLKCLSVFALIIAIVASSAEAAQLTVAGGSASTFLSDQTNPINVVNGAGLGDFLTTTANPLGDAHVNNQEQLPGGVPCCDFNMWVSFAETSWEYFEIDLGQNFTLGTGALRVWNYDHTTLTNRGVKSIGIKTLADDGTPFTLGCTGDGTENGGPCTHPVNEAGYTSVNFQVNGGGFAPNGNLSKAPGTTNHPSPTFDYNTPDTIDFENPISARFIRITALTSNDCVGCEPTHGSTFGNLGLAEIKVFSDVGAGAATFNWTGNSGNWNDANNWNPTGGPPVSAEHTAVFALDIGTQTVFTNSNVSVNRVEFNSASSYNISGPSAVGVTIDRGTDPQLADTGIFVSQGNHEFQATVTLQDNAEVNVPGGSTLIFNNALNLSGNTLTKSGGGEIGIRNDFVTGGGTIVIDGGTVSGNGTVGGDLDNSGGTVSPGNSPGVLEVSGDYTQGSHAALSIEIAGTQAGVDHDLLSVGGTAQLSGLLEVSLLDGFDPQVGDRFDLLDASAISGGFADVVLPALSAGLSWDDSALYSIGSLSIVPEPSSTVLMGLGAVMLLFRRLRDDWVFC